jgi:hypothetical protein
MKVPSVFLAQITAPLIFLAAIAAWKLASMLVMLSWGWVGFGCSLGVRLLTYNVMRTTIFAVKVITADL